MAGKKTVEISLIGESLALQYFDNDHVAQPIEYYPVCSIKGIIGLPQIGYGARDANNQPKNRYQFVDMFNVTIYLEGEKHALSFDIQQVINQPGWTSNLAGLNQALADLNTWSQCGCCTVLTGISAQLTSILNAIIASDQDFEMLLVRDTGNADQVVQQITDWSTGSPVYSYRDVNGAVYVPVGTLVYLDPASVLNLILTQFTGDVVVTQADISGNAAYITAASTYNSIQLIIDSGTVNRGGITYSAGVWSITAPLNKTLPTFTFDATGAVATIELMTP